MPQKKHPKYAKLSRFGQPVPWGLPLETPAQDEPKDDGVDVEVFRAEILARTAALHQARYAVERELGLTDAPTIKSWKPMVTYKAVYEGKGDKKRLVAFESLITQAQHERIREATHPFAFSAVQVRNELAKGA
jgi:hypothetical protein